MKVFAFIKSKVRMLVWSTIFVAGVGSLFSTSFATNIFKANNNVALNTPGSWTNGTVPGSTDVAIFDANITTAVSATNVLGGNLIWNTLAISNSAAPVQISADGNTLTLTNLTMAGAAVDLTLNCALVIGGANAPTWQVGANASTIRKLTIGSAVTGPGNIKQQYGKILLAPAAGSLPVAMSYSFSGNSTLDLGGNSQTLASIIPAWGATSVISNGYLTLTGPVTLQPQNSSTIDLSGLSSLVISNPVQAVTINCLTNTGFSYGTNVTVNLANQGVGFNFIAASSINLGTGGNSTTSNQSFLHLGGTNIFYIGPVTNNGSVNIGAYRNQNALIDFQGGHSNSALILRGYGGDSNRVSLVEIALCNAGTQDSTGTLDSSLGTIDCMASNVVLAEFNSGKSAYGNLNISNTASIFDTLNLTLSQKDAGSSAGLTAQATINQYAGIMKANSLMFGVVDATNSVSSAIQAGYNLNGGTLRAQTIQPGTDGTVAFSTGSYRTIFWTNGTIQNYDTGTPLTIASGGSVAMTISAPGTGYRYFTVDSGLTNIIQCIMTQLSATSSPVVKNGSGALDIQGTNDNPYFSLNVSNGVVLLDKTSGSGVHAINNGLTVSGGTAYLAGTGGDQIADADVVTLNGGTLDLNGRAETLGGLAGSGGTLADSVGGGILTDNVAGGTNYISAATLTGGNLLFGGSGTQILTGTDSRSGTTTTVSNGVLQIGNGGTAGTLAGNIPVNSPGDLSFDRSDTNTFSGNITGSGSLAQIGTGTTILSSTNTFTGPVNLNAGAISVATVAPNGTASPLGIGSTLAFNGGTVRYTGSAVPAGSFNRLVTLGTNGGTIDQSGSSYFFLTNQISGSGSLTKIGSGQMILGDGVVGSGSNNYSGITYIVNGNLQIRNISALGSPTATTVITDPGNFSVSSGGGFPGPVQENFNLSGRGGGNGALNLTSAGYDFSGNLTLVTNAGIAVWTVTNTISGSISGTGQFEKLGSGTLALLNNNNTYVNGTLITAGTLQLGTNGTSGWLPAPPAGTALTNNSVLSFDRSDTNTFSSNITGSGNLAQNGTGTIILSGANTFTGPVNLNAGAISVATVALNGTASPLGAGSTLAFNGGTFRYTGSTVPVGSFNRLVTLGANGGTIDQSGSSYFFLTNQISGSGSLTKIGSGQIILGDEAAGSGSNNYSGTTYIVNGNVQIRNASALGSLTGITVITDPGNFSVGLSGGIGFPGSVQESFNLSGRGGGNGALNLTSGGYDFSGNFTLATNAGVAVWTVTNSISGPIGGTGQFEKFGSGVLALLNNSNTYTGGTLITAGTLQLGTNGTSGWLPAQPAGTALTNNGVLSFDRSDTNTFSSNITGSGNLNQNGTGTIILSGANTSVTTTTVNNGNLLINGIWSGPAKAQSVGTLGGNGDILGAVTISTNSFLAAGAGSGSIGTLTISNNLTISGSIFIKVNKASAQSNDFVIVSGSPNNNGYGTVMVTNLGPALAVGDKFKLFNQPLANGQSMLIVGGGNNVVWANTLAVDGSITVEDISVLDQDFNTLVQRWAWYVTGGTNINLADPIISNEVSSAANLAATYWSTLNTSPGRTYLWSDAASTNVSADITTCYTRLAAMAQGYAMNGSPLYGNASLASDILNGLDWMYTNRYNPSKSEYDNWFDWEINGPLELNLAVVLMYPLVTGTEITNFCNAIDHFTPNVTRDGANRVWEAEVIGVRGAIQHNAAKVGEARDGLSDVTDGGTSNVFSYVTTSDGFYQDGSYLFHTAHPYTAGYGIAEFGDLAKVIDWVSPTAFAITDRQETNVVQWCYDSYEPLVYFGALPEHVRGREITRMYDGYFVGHEAVNAILRIAQTAPTNDAALLNSMVKYWGEVDPLATLPNYVEIELVGTAESLLANTNVTPRGELIGQFQFPSMDRVMHLRPGFGFGLSMFSSRVYNYESIDSENRHGWFNAYGMTYLFSTRDLTQFTDNFWWTVDPYHLPGITADLTPLADSTNQSETSTQPWVGGTALSNSVGSAGMSLADVNGSLVAKKSWFMFDNEIVCLGAGISCSSATNVQTTVEERNLHTSPGNTFVVNGTTMSIAPGWNANLTNVSWCALDASGGYYFPNGANLSAACTARTGAESNVGGSGSSTTPVTRNYFSLVLDHGIAPSNASYAYVLLPLFTASAVSNYVQSPPVVILTNSAVVQAARQTEQGITAANFWNDGTNVVDFISCAQKASVVTSESADGLALAVSDPTWTNTSAITITLNRSATSLISADPGVTVVQLSPQIQLSINVANARGKTFQARFSYDPPAPPIAAEPDFAITSTNMPVLINVLANDYSTNGPLTLVSVAAPSHGVATITNQMVFYVPVANFAGLDTFNYIITDGTLMATGIVSVAVGSSDLIWRGDGIANSWDNNSTNVVWFNDDNNTSSSFNLGANVLFDNSSTNLSVNISASLSPASVIVNTTNNYTFVDHGGAIGGAIGLTKTNTGTLYVQNNNTFTGPVNLNGGMISVATVAPNGIASPLGKGGALAFNGGTFQYTGGAVPVGAFSGAVTLGPNGGTIDQSGYSYFFLTNQISGSGTLAKIGSGELILGDIGTGTGNNTYSGITYVTNGQLELRNVNALGSTAGKTVVTAPGNVTAGGGMTGTIAEPFDLSGNGDGNGALQAQDPGTTIVYSGNLNLVANAGIGIATISNLVPFSISGNISGVGGLTKLDANTITLLGTNTYAGGTTIAAGTLQLGNNGTSGWLPAQPAGTALTNNGTLCFDRSDTNAFNSNINGGGSLIQNGSGTTILGGTNNFTGKIAINIGFLLVTNANAFGADPAVGSIDVGYAPGNTNTFALQLAGGINITNSITLREKTLINSGAGAQPPNLSNVSGTNEVSSLLQIWGGAQYWGINCDAGLLMLTTITNTGGTNTRSLYLEGTGNGTITTDIGDWSNFYLQLVKYGTGTWTDSGTATLPLGVWVYQGQLVINSTVNAGTNSATASLVDGGTLFINGTLPGTVVVTNGMLGGGGDILGAVTTATNGIISPGTNIVSIGTLTISNSLTTSGNFLIKLNKSMTQSNDLVVVSGLLTNTTTGAIIVTNLGPALTAGDRFVIFNQPLLNGNLLSISNIVAGVAWTNNLALDGSISVLSANQPLGVKGIISSAFAISYSMRGHDLLLSWPPNRLGWRLQVQTNSLNIGLSDNWSDWPNSTTVTNVDIQLNSGTPAVFFRMFHP